MGTKDKRSKSPPESDVAPWLLPSFGPPCRAWLLQKKEEEEAKKRIAAERLQKFEEAKRLRRERKEAVASQLEGAPWKRDHADDATAPQPQSKKAPKIAKIRGSAGEAAATPPTKDKVETTQASRSSCGSKENPTLLMGEMPENVVFPKKCTQKTFDRSRTSKADYVFFTDTST